MKAGNEIKLDCDNTIQLISNAVDTVGLTGNMIPTALQFGSKLLAGSFLGADFITDGFTLPIG